MAPLTISLLGPPAVRHGAAEVRFPTRKTLALLVYLAAEPAVHSRERLISPLWPEADQDHGPPLCERPSACFGAPLDMRLE